MNKALSVVVIKEEKARKKAYFVTALVLQGLIIVNLAIALTLGIVAYVRDHAWNSHLSDLRNVSEALVIADDLTFYMTPTQVKPNLADEMFGKALKSSDLPSMVTTTSDFTRLSYRETPMQLIFVTIVALLTVALIAQLLTHLIVSQRRFNHDKWCLITYSVAVILLILAFSLYIRSQRQINSNYIAIANLIRAEAIELTGFVNDGAVAETLHSCQLRAIVRGQSEALKARLAARRVCDLQNIKVVTIVKAMSVVAALLIVSLLLVVTWCQREPKLKDNAMLHNVSALSLYIDLSPEDFRRAGFAFGEESEVSSVSSGSGLDKDTLDKFKKDKKDKRGSGSSDSTSGSTGSNTSFTFGNRKKLKRKFKNVSKETKM